MKRKFLISTTAVLAVTATVVAVIFYACHKETFSKEGTVKSHVLTSYYDQELLNQFMGEPLVEQLREIIHSYNLTVNNE